MRTPLPNDPRPPSRGLAALLVLLALGACGAEPGGVGVPGDGTASALEHGAPASAAQLPDAGPGGAQDRILAEKYRAIDPRADGWDTEVLNSTVGSVLHHVGDAWAAPGGPHGEHLDGTCDPAFTTSGLRPERLQPLYVDGPQSVRAAPGAVDAGVDGRGEEALLRALRDLRAPYAPDAELHVKFKVVTVEAAGERAETAALFQADGEAAGGGRLSQNATWHATWSVDDPEAPRLLALRVEDYAENRSDTGPLFEDCTLSVLGGTEAWRDQLGVHVETWLGTIQGMLYSEFLGHQGLAVGDVDGDGLEDVYLCQAGGLPNRLLLQNPDGTVRDVSKAAGVDFLDPSRGVLLVDLDGDRDQDLLVSMAAAVVFLENDGSARFEPRWMRPLPQIHSMAAADYDRDGDLDVYGCAYKVPDDRGVAPLPYHDANNGEPNVLLRNEGGWSFTDVTAETGLDVNNRRYSFAASWEDYDNDGDLDLYVANDFGRNNLYRNEGGRFVDVAGDAGVEDISAGMAVSWADYDNDGWMDVHVSNMFSSAGNRIAYQRNFQAAADDATLSHFRRHARGNSLFRNAGDGTFHDESLAAGITMGRWAWGSKFGDLNNDGLQDVLVVNGLVTSDQPHDL